MKIRNITTALAVLTLLTACDDLVKPDTQIVTWEVEDGQTFALIDGRKDMQIAYDAGAYIPTPQSQNEPTDVGRILLTRDLSSNDKPIKLNKFPFVYKQPGQNPVQIACPNCVPCISGDDCVPPTPPKLQNLAWPAVERFICAGGAAQFNDPAVCGLNCGTACSITSSIP